MDNEKLSKNSCVGTQNCEKIKCFVGTRIKIKNILKHIIPYENCTRSSDCENAKLYEFHKMYSGTTDI